MNEIDFKDVPTGWALCFMHQCVWRGDCLRYLAGESLPAGQTVAPSVLPQALTERGCRERCPLKTERLVWGFTHLFDAVSHKDYAPLRHEIVDFLGSRYEYYRYHKGVRKLRECQQREIARLFCRYGYTQEPVFDHAEPAAIFS